jgi:hypothetical protein
MEKFPPYFLDDLRARLPVSEVVGRRVKLKRAGREWKGLSPFNKEKTPSFTVNDQKGFYKDFSSGKHGDIFAFVMETDGLTFPQAVESLAKMAGLPMPADVKVRSRTPAEQRAFEEDQARRQSEADARRMERDAEQALDEAQQIEKAARIYRPALELAGTQGEAYLVGRGLPVPPNGWPDVIRFVPRLYHPFVDKQFPAIVARVDDKDGDFSAIWRIYLDQKRPVKAPVGDSVKLGLGSAVGGAVRIGGIAEHTDTGEGLESSLGAWSLIRCRRPVWATLSTSGMAGFDPPPEIKRCDQFPDGDFPKRKSVREGETDTGELADDPTPAGLKAARALRRRLDEIHVAGVINPTPPPGQDYLDIWNNQKKFLED